MNQKILKRTLLTVVLMLAMVGLTACAASGPDGTYTSTGSGIAETVTFSNGKDITMNAFGIDGAGTYKINDNNTITVTYTVLGMNSTQTFSFSQNGNNINFDGQTLAKQ